MLHFFKKKKNTEYRFQETENTACIVCDHVLNGKRPILHVTHDAEDGYWQFLCGQDHHEDTIAKLISLKQATELDSTINELFEMPLGFGAERNSIKDKWKLYKSTETE